MLVRNTRWVRKFLGSVKQLLASDQSLAKVTPDIGAEYVALAASLFSTACCDCHRNTSNAPAHGSLHAQVVSVHSVRMLQVVSTLTKYHEPDGGRHDRNAIVYLVHTQVLQYLKYVPTFSMLPGR